MTDKRRPEDNKKDVEGSEVPLCPNCDKPALVWNIDKNYGVCPHCGKKFLRTNKPLQPDPDGNTAS